MTKNDKQRLAGRCGYEYIYSGKTKRGYFKELSGTQNVKVDSKDFKKLTEVIAQENK